VANSGRLSRQSHITHPFINQLATMQKSYKPAHNYLLLIPSESSEMSSGGLYLPETARNKINEGTVIACGPTAGAFTPGQTVVFKQHSEYVVNIEKKKHVVVSTDDIILFTDAPQAKAKTDPVGV